MTMELIQHIELGSNASTISFSSINQTYTDLYLLTSLRSTIASTNDFGGIQFNGDTANNYSFRLLQGDGSGVISTNGTYNSALSLRITGANATSNTFSNGAIYIPNYTSSAAKSVSSDAVSENNATQAVQNIWASQWTGTAAITSLVLVPNSGQFVAGSSATLYGIRRFNTTLSPKATGGAISYDPVNNKWVHAFYTSGTFTPTENLTGVEYLVVAGGGGGGYEYGGGGGAGGFLTGTTSVTSSTNYTVTIGAGGAGATSVAKGGSGGNSSAFSVTATGGGGGGRWQDTAGVSGGSGGGAGSPVSGTSSGASGTSGQGNAGGNGFRIVSGPDYLKGGGGGGAGAAGDNAPQTADTSGANGGIGLQSSITGTAVYYAGGGGGHNYQGTTRTTGGLGGGGFGSTQDTNVATGHATPGTPNTGGGGGGGADGGAGRSKGASGGSGIVIVRYSA